MCNIDTVLSSSYRQTTLDSHTREMSDLGDISYAMELQFNAREVDAQNDFQSIMDEIKNKVPLAKLNVILIVAFMFWFST